MNPREWTGRCDDFALDLPAFAEGALRGPMAGEVREHLESCARCSREVAELRTLLGLFEVAPEPSVDDVGRARLGLRRRLVQNDAAPRERWTGALPSALTRAAALVLSTALLATLARTAPAGAGRPLFRSTADRSTSESNASGSEGTSLLAWMRSVESAARLRLAPWIPELPVPALFEMLPKDEDRRTSILRPTRNG